MTNEHAIFNVMAYKYLVMKIQERIAQLDADAKALHLHSSGAVDKAVQGNKMKYAADVLRSLLQSDTNHDKVRVARKVGWMSTLGNKWERGQPVSILHKGQFRKGWVVGYTQGSTMGMAGAVKVKLADKDIIADIYETHAAKLQGSVLADFIATHGALDHDSFGAPDWVGGDPTQDKNELYCGPWCSEYDEATAEGRRCPGKPLCAQGSITDPRSAPGAGESDLGSPVNEPGGGVEADDPRWAYYSRSLKTPRGHGTHGRIRMRFYYHMRELVECVGDDDSLVGKHMVRVLTSMLDTYAERYNIDKDDEIMVRRTSPVTD